MKRKESNLFTTEELIAKFSGNKHCTAKSVLSLVSVITLVSLIGLSAYIKIADIPSDEEEFTLTAAPVAEVSTNKSVISIPTGMVKTNPFLPYRKLGDEEVVPKLVDDVPKFDLLEPPDFVSEDTEAAKIMDTAVSGILFDKYSPTAILNIDGNDYLVKKGDTVHNYKVLNIAQNSVTVQLGKNTYQAGIGEILKEGKINHNDISNLSNKFGGEKR